MKLSAKRNKVGFVLAFLTGFGGSVTNAQLRIDDVSPKATATTLTLGDFLQSVSGKGQTIAISADGLRVYLGGHSGVWRSDDGGANWLHPEHAQPAGASVQVAGALLCPNVYDLLISPANSNIVLAATGWDARVPSKAGIYRSVDAGANWTLVHQFINQTSTGNTSRMVVAPDDPNKIYVAGQFAAAKSTDGGVTWSDVKPQGTTGGSVWSVVAGPQQGVLRKIYAIGSRIWYSTDDGTTWQADATSLPLNITVGAPSDAVSSSARTIVLHPSNPNIIYVNSGGKIWRGDFTAVTGGGMSAWTQLPAPPGGYANTTQSGNDYIDVRMSTTGQLYFFFSDKATSHICVGEPTSSASWTRIDQPNVHLDPHGIDMTPSFRYAKSGPGAFGRIVMVSDGGAYFSTDGAATWQHGKGLSTLGIVNATVMAVPGGVPAICIGMGDNSGFYSRDGGNTWKTQDYVGGDNDACFSDPLQPNKLVVFAPRSGDKGVFLYTAPVGQTPDGTVGTNQRKSIPCPPLIANDRSWNAVSNHYYMGYRPLVYSLAGQTPRPDGDFVTIRYTGTKAVLLRSTALSTITSMNDWATAATDESSGAKAFQQGPDLPVIGMNVVQTSGGHDAPVFFTGDVLNSQHLWKWTKGMAQWQQLVPGPLVNGVNVPAVATRFYVDPYRPNIIYVLDKTAVWRSDNGGSTWVNDTRLQSVLTENGAYPLVIPFDDNALSVLLMDMIFDPYNPGYRFAIGPAGVFYTADGANWQHLIVSSAMSIHPNNATYNPCDRTLYVGTSNRGLLRLSPLPPDFEGPIGSLNGAQGRITMLRVNEVGTKYGPPSDQLDAEVIVQLDSRVGKAFGFQLRTDGNEKARRGMLDQLRQAFNRNSVVNIDYTRTGCNTGTILRVMLP